jgi:hypothetical protein
MQINYSSTAANSGEEAEEVELLTPQAPYTIESTYLYKFYFHDIELGIAKKIKGLAGKVQMLQKMFEKSLLLASLWAGLALIMALLFLVIIAGRH